MRSLPASAPVCELAALAPAAVRPALSTTTGFFLVTRRATSAKDAPILEVLQMLGDDMGFVVGLEEGEQIVLVEVGLVAEADDGGDAHLGGTAEADDRHADAARIARRVRHGRGHRRACRRSRRDWPAGSRTRRCSAPSGGCCTCGRSPGFRAGLPRCRSPRSRRGSARRRAMLFSPHSSQRAARRTWRGSRTPRHRSRPARP